MRDSLLLRTVALAVVAYAWAGIANAQTSQTYCVSPLVAIPDNNPAGINIQLNVPDFGTIADLDVSLEIPHTWQGDLNAQITNPSATTTVPLFFRPGDSDGVGFGFSADNFAAGFTLDDEAARAYDLIAPDGWGDGSVPDPGIANVTGSWLPHGMFPGGGIGGLTGFDGQEVNGNWTINISDNAGGDQGTVNEICLIVQLPNCQFNAELRNPAVNPDGRLDIAVYLLHNKPRTEVRSFLFEILDENRTVLYQRETRDFTIRYLGEIERDWSLRLPSGLPAGRYTLRMDISGMNQGVATTEQRFFVRPEAVAPVSLPSFAMSEELGGDWIAVEGASAALPASATLQSYPNPFNPATTLTFSLQESGPVNLVVFDVTGREVARLLNGTLDAGSHQVNFDASNLPSGMYFARLTAGAETQTQRITLLK